MIAIVRVSGDKDDLCHYELRINTKILTEFDHKRSDGLSKCLQQATKAAKAYEKSVAGRLDLYRLADPTAMFCDGMDHQLMVMAAHRYTLGRASYIVGVCIHWLKKIWHQLESQTQTIIIRDTVEAIEENRAGMDADKEEWQKFLTWVEMQKLEKD